MKASLSVAQIIFIDDVAEKCHIWIHNQNYKVTPIKFKKFIEQNLLTQLGVSKKKTIDVSTAVRWLNIFGYTKQRQKQGVYYDGYEHADGENMDQILPDLAEGEKEHILVTHDKCIFYSNDGQCEIDGRLKLKPTDIEQYPTVLAEACEYLEPGKDREGYWIAENVLNQIKTKAILIFEILYPNCIGVFAFDNSSNHAIFAKDALVSKRMNLNSGECKECKEKKDDENWINCCAHRVMSLEPDFLAQKGAIAEIIKKASYKCIFYSKFYCELNFIERYWGLQRGMQERIVIIHGQD
ncbi:hypothetical protein RIR_jg20284.t1 [Rhizophagus irregularis DAOM 181602=DAOM 197198]|nr:hypothetical protein RIR_jg20284.t1 [Rhizophagus irregularis DAOM 181602=DAOM 197198]